MGNLYLSTPCKEKNPVDGETAFYRFASNSMKGWRKSMEDFCFAHSNVGLHGTLFGVFDGHGGSEVARFCSEYFCKEFQKTREFLDGRIEEALKKTFLLMDEIIISPEGQKKLKAFMTSSEDASHSGATAHVVYVEKRTLYVANAGNCRSVLFRNGEVLRLSEDHKPDNDIEKQRISNAGGFIIDGRVNGNLNLSRAIGDFDYKLDIRLKPHEQLISAVPDVFKVELQEGDDAFLLAGSDGVWEALDEKTVCQVVHSNLKQELQLSSILGFLFESSLGEDTVKGIGCDNMSAVLIRFK